MPRESLKTFNDTKNNLSAKDISLSTLHFLQIKNHSHNHLLVISHVGDARGDGAMISPAH
jgi:hypothetical protein